MDKINFENIYYNRFSKEDVANKNKIWQVLCRNFFQKYINKEDTVIDIGAGLCEFINNIKCKKKIALDKNIIIRKYSHVDVETIIESAESISKIKNNSVHVVFMSNFLEHLNSKNDIIEILMECRRILKKKGRIMILQPNIRFSSNVYWDFFDHNIPLSDRALIEILLAINFKVIKNIPKFLPYTVKSALPKNDFLIKIYLKFPLFWNFFGKQFFICAEKS